MPLTIAILLFDGVEELDFARPWKVFTMARACRDGPEEITVVPIAERAGPLTCAKGFKVTPDHDLASEPKLDLLLVPGGQGTRSEASNPALLDWIATVAAGCRATRATATS